MNDPVQSAVSSLEDAIGYSFRDKELLRQALTHSSFSNEHKRSGMQDYERLEFLGDSVLEMVSSVFLYERYPACREGELTRRRAALVCEKALSESAASIGLKDFLYLGKGEEASGGRQKDSILADVMEALIGAVYLDGGIDEATGFIRRFVLEDSKRGYDLHDAKSLLQEYTQGLGLGTVQYVLLDASGPEHEKIFTCAVRMGNEELGRGEGRNKKSAEQQAAAQALRVLQKKESV